jgi:quercetin dioxygenase-like cupin family protein
MSNNPDHTETDRLSKHGLVELLDYLPHAVVSKTIIKKATGDITIFSIAEGEQVAERFLPFDTYIQVIDGTAAFIINESKYLIGKGEGILIPAHMKHNVTPGSQFKMVCTVIKSGYEE